ncbi:unnamed protein product [Rotaria sp. Silwood2]|nr:unnamed protein product [Rotaria sp. Silwood2]
MTSYVQQEKPQYIQKRRITTSRTFVNGEMTAMNHLKKRKSIAETNYQVLDTNDIDSNKNTNQQQQYQDDHQSKLSICSHAPHYAVEQHLPPINIKWEPKIHDKKIATNLIEELFTMIKKSFRKQNTKYTKPLGCDYWFIDRDSNMQCYTREIELFVFPCGLQNDPSQLSNTTINPNLSKRLPPQRSIILKYLLGDINIDDIKLGISSKYQSIFNVEEMRGTIGERSRCVHIDLTAHDEYMRILYAEVMTIGDLLLEVSEFLAPPRWVGVGVGVDG